MAYIKRLLYPIAYLLASIVLVMFFGVSLVFASPIYTPGETLNPGCLPINPDCTVTPQVLLTGNNSWTGTQQFSNILSPYFTATSTATASVFPYASTTAISATTVCISTDCKTAWPAGGTSFFETGVDTNNIKNTNTGNVGVGVFTANNDPTNLLHINSVSSPITSQFRVSTGMNNVGAVTGAVVNSVGSGYSVNDIVTVVGGDNNATLKIDSVTNGQVNNFSINAGGTGYTVGDILTISGGNANSTVSVATLKAP